MPKLRFDQYLSVVFFSLALLLVGSLLPLEMIVKAEDVNLLQVAPIPVLKTDHDSNLLSRLSATNLVVIDKPSAAILLAKDPFQSVPMASTTKLMTALVVRDTYDLDQLLTVREERFTLGNTMELEMGEVILVRNLLDGLLIASGNDAAFLLANNHPQGYGGFVENMNQKAQALNLEQTSFTNPSGLDAETHFSSAHDLALLAKAVSQDELLAEIVKTKSKLVTDQTGQIEHYLVNTNELLEAEEGIVGFKTGTTPLAREVLITEVQRNGRDFIMVVLGSQDRYAETKQIIGWVFENYEWHEFD